MNDETMPSFPPFVPAKPKGGVQKELDEAKHPLEVVAPKRKRRTAAEIAAAEGTVPKKRKKRQPRPSTVPIDALVAFAGLATEEIEQVIAVCEAINTFPKQARRRIAAAIGQLFS